MILLSQTPVPITRIDPTSPHMLIKYILMVLPGHHAAGDSPVTHTPVPITGIDPTSPHMVIKYILM